MYRANRTMNKDNVNKIFGISFISLITIMIFSYIGGNGSIYGFPNLIMLYGAIPLFLVWFGTRKNGCGSCNQEGRLQREKIEKNPNNKE